jgi:hypothetical protein
MGAPMSVQEASGVGIRERTKADDTGAIERGALGQPVGRWRVVGFGGWL